MREKAIDVLEFVEQDMESVMKGRDFDELKDEEKAIDELQAIWSHPDNEVRNRIKIFAERSPEILKPIDYFGLTMPVISVIPCHSEMGVICR